MKSKYWQKRRNQPTVSNSGNRLKEIGIRHGFRSGLEDKIAKQMLEVF